MTPDLQKHHTALISAILAIKPNVFLTLAFPYAQTDEMAFTALRHFDAKLSKMMLGRKWISMPEKRITFWAAAEHVETNYHFHVAAHLSVEQAKFCNLKPAHDKEGNSIYLSDVLQPLWQDISKGGALDIRPITKPISGTHKDALNAVRHGLKSYDPIRVADYMLKSYERALQPEAFDRVVSSGLLRGIRPSSVNADTFKKSGSFGAYRPKFQNRARPSDDAAIAEWKKAHEPSPALLALRRILNTPK